MGAGIGHLLFPCFVHDLPVYVLRSKPKHEASLANIRWYLANDKVALRNLLCRSSTADKFTAGEFFLGLRLGYRVLRSATKAIFQEISQLVFIYLLGLDQTLLIHRLIELTTFVPRSIAGPGVLQAGTPFVFGKP